MIEKLIEALFRHALLIVLPAVVIPLDVAAAVLSTPPQYEAQAGMWVEQATYLSYSTDDLNRYLPPSQNQRNRLVELLQTRSFLADVASTTTLAPIANAPNGDEFLREIFARDFDVTASGDHLLVLRFRAEDRSLSVAVLDALVTAFKGRASADRYGQAQVAISFYQGRLTDSESELAAARTALAQYLGGAPQVAAILTKSGIDAARLDPQFAEAQRKVDASQKDADAARAALDRAEADVAAGVQGLEFGFRLVDPVQASTSPSRQLKKVLIYPLAALLAGLILSAALLLLFALSDHSLRSLADLSPDTVILGVLPRLRPKGIAGRQGTALVRRSVEFTAGAPLALRGEKRRVS
jgi:uncharacterized protein involved in exopolysaccharide biosynthesis